MMTEPVDLAQIRSFSGGDLAVERELVQIFVEQSDKNLHELETNCRDGMNPVWQEAAHMFKGGASSAGAAELSRLCLHAQNMENATATARTALWGQIDREYRRVKTYLQACGRL